jgi:membrane protein involved in colicin uptake
MTLIISSAEWRKSSHSGGQGGECVELAAMVDSVAIRDSKDPDGARLLVNRRDFKRFAKALKNP